MVWTSTANHIRFNNAKPSRRIERAESRHQMFRDRYPNIKHHNHIDLPYRIHSIHNRQSITLSLQSTTIFIIAEEEVDSK